MKMSLNYLKDNNINKHIYFLADQIKTFRKINAEELNYHIAMQLEIYLKNNDLNTSLIKIFQSFIPDDVTALSFTKIKFLATATKRVRKRYES